jgi:hypothetical protein
VAAQSLGLGLIDLPDLWAFVEQRDPLVNFLVGRHSHGSNRIVLLARF